MIVAHLGPPLARTGGPAGYLWQLRDALAGAPPAATVTFPEPGAAAAPAAAPVALIDRLRRRVTRALTGAPRFYRPPADELERRGGRLDVMMRSAVEEMARAAEPSLARAIHDRADVLFAHDFGSASAALARRAPGQQVWLMLHSPMPTALYLAWNWGVPEQAWPMVMAYPDVRVWTGHEIDVCGRVDRLLLPCREAADELARCDHRFASLLARAETLLTGGSRGSAGSQPAAALRARFRLPIDQPVGLFLGSLQAYRGFDTLVAGLDRLDPAVVPGTIAVAGPPPASVPVHDRVRPLGRVDDVAALLGAVDFVVNVNRFSLFDLSLVEALEAGRPLLLHDAGGNRAFRSLGAGIVPMPDLLPATVAAGLEACFTMPAARREALGQQSRRCYEQQLTPAHFAARHAALYAHTAGRARGRVIA